MSASPTTDQRSDPRQTLMLRTAKVICQSGEYVCLVRNVSQGGVGLSFLHPVPQESRIFLELSNGALYPIERTWTDESQAGYRFAAPVDLDAFISESSAYSHRPVRMRLKMPVLLTVAGDDHGATLADISRSGARLICASPLPTHAAVRLEAVGLPLLFGTLCWRKGQDHGMVFNLPLTLEDLARRLFALQPTLVDEPEQAGSDQIRAA